MRQEILLIEICSVIKNNLIGVFYLCASSSHTIKR